jgi:hypothetical protein
VTGPIDGVLGTTELSSRLHHSSCAALKMRCANIPRSVLILEKSQPVLNLKLRNFNFAQSAQYHVPGVTRAIVLSITELFAKSAVHTIDLRQILQQ